MKTRIKPLPAALLLAAHLVFLAPPALVAADLPEGVAAELAALDKKRADAMAWARRPVTDLAEKYVEALTQFGQTAKQAGDLRKFLAADEELKRVRAGAVKGGAPADAEVARLQSTFEGNLSVRQREVTLRMIGVERMHAAALAGMVAELTKAGMIEEAKHVLGLEQEVRKAIKKLDGGTITHPLRAPVAAELVLIPAGAFTMGDQNDGSKDAPPHRVNLSEFHIAKHEVTKALWDEVRGWGLKNGYTDLPEGGGKAADHPVHSVNWYAVLKWCNARSEKERLKPCYSVDSKTYRTGAAVPDCDWKANGYRLPTEAEWEKAARGGLKGKRFPWGDTISHLEANFRNNGNQSYQHGTRECHPKYVESVYPYTSPVGSFEPNNYGLCDMVGNVWEWCWGAAGSYALDSQTDPRGPSLGWRMLRGGCWSYDANSCRVANRFSVADSGLSSNDLGFRLARSSVP